MEADTLEKGNILYLKMLKSDKMNLALFSTVESNVVSKKIRQLSGGKEKMHLGTQAFSRFATIVDRHNVS